MGRVLEEKQGLFLYIWAGKFAQYSSQSVAISFLKSSKKKL